MHSTRRITSAATDRRRLRLPRRLCGSVFCGVAPSGMAERFGTDLRLARIVLIHSCSNLLPQSELSHQGSKALRAAQHCTNCILQMPELRCCAASCIAAQRWQRYQRCGIGQSSERLKAAALPR